jgi:hypothetical protein
MSENISDDLEAKVLYLRECLARFKQIQEVIPYVQQNLEIAEWELETLRNLPSKLRTPLPASLSGSIQRDFNYVREALPQPPYYDSSKVRNSIPVTTSGTATVYGYVANLSQLEDPNLIDYSTTYTSRYREIQERQQRARIAGSLVLSLGNQNTHERFERAYSAYYSAKSGVRETRTAALEMRNLIDGFQGALLDKARKWPKENMTWQSMAARLAKGGTGGVEYQEILNQEAIRSGLISQLSSILKDRAVVNNEVIDHIWAQLIDHIFVIVGLVDM